MATADTAVARARFALIFLNTRVAESTDVAWLSAQESVARIGEWFTACTNY
jgi:hypothetical protein